MSSSEDDDISVSDGTQTSLQPSESTGSVVGAASAPVTPETGAPQDAATHTGRSRQRRNTTQNGPQHETMKEFLDEDVYSLMMIAESWKSSSWALGIFTFCVELLLAIFLIWEEGDIPLNVGTMVRIGHIICLLLFVTYQSDVLSAIRYFSILRNNKEELLGQVIGPADERSGRTFEINACIPIMLKFIQGYTVMCVSFSVLAQTTTLIDLFKDFVAMMVIADIDDQVFKLAANGYFGEKLQQETIKVKDKVIEDTGNDPEKRNQSYKDRIIIFYQQTFLCLFICYFLFIIFPDQVYRLSYPDCGNKNLDLAKKHFGDGICYGGSLNTLGCKFESGDCRDFNLAYPLCKGDNLIHVQERIGNEKCDEDLNIRECDFDGGDCCPYEMFRSLSYGDGFCNGGLRSTSQCGYDGGDCHEMRRKYPNCTLDDLAKEDGSEAVILGDGICDSDIYNSEACGWENGDCKKDSE